MFVFVFGCRFRWSLGRFAATATASSLLGALRRCANRIFVRGWDHHWLKCPSGGRRRRRRRGRRINIIRMIAFVVAIVTSVRDGVVETKSSSCFRVHAILLLLLFLFFLLLFLLTSGQDRHGRHAVDCLRYAFSRAVR